MTEIITKGNSYYKEINVSYDEDGESVPVDLTNYDDNYFSITKDRGLSDSDAIIFEKIGTNDPKNGILTINLFPDETKLLPNTNRDNPYLYGFVQIGSTITGHVHEVASFKIKVKDGGIKYITEIDKSYDMGCVNEASGWIFDAGSICETVTVIEYFGTDDGLIIYNGGSLKTDSIEIINFGKLNLVMPEVIDFGNIRSCERRC